MFGLQTTVTLYDLTNTYFEGVAAAQPLAQHGHSKEKRSDCPLLTLALVLDGSGFVRRSEVMDGKLVEGEVLRGVLERLEVPKGALIVMDCGAATEQNLKWLRDHGVSLSGGQPGTHAALRCGGGREPDDGGPAAGTGTEGAQRRWAEVRLYCYSPARKGKEQAMLKKACARFEKALQELHEGLSRPRTHKKIEVVWRRIGRMKSTSSGAGQHLSDQGSHR